MSALFESAWHPLVGGNPPDWASGWGQDRHGVFVELTVGEATQRLRWIGPGRFVIGSPADEPGRWDDEGPRHEVVIGQGYWLFDTACTQGLWTAVMGENPSEFKHPGRPVETVSWEDAQAFLVRLNDQIPGLELVLPSEAQWEYACRAGSETATYAGSIEILGANNAPVLDAIAWYGGNSGFEFDLDEGYDSSDWREKQYPHDQAGTRLVKQKRPNAWGLHDMLGNVWEWCADHWHDSYEGAPANGTPWLEAKGGESRVLRGGSWNDDARGCRSACRSRRVPGYRGDCVGFRPARVQS